MGDEEVEALRRRIEDLKIEHRDLDDVINRLSRDSTADELQLRRLKKRKLHIKDMISRLQNALLPDLEA